MHEIKQFLNFYLIFKILRIFFNKDDFNLNKF